MIGVSVVVEELRQGTVSNSYGYYALNIPDGSYTLRFSYIGYKEVSRKLQLTEDLQEHIRLAETNVLIQEVVVSESALDDPVKNTEMGDRKSVV